MIPRYTRPEMGRIWSEENKYTTWWKVELEVCRVQHQRGLIPEEAFRDIESHAAFNVDRILEIETGVRHDVIAFLTNVSESIGPAARFVHKGLTSSDLLDTALALQLTEAGELILTDLKQLENLLNAKSIEYKDYLMIGRTHGVHAEPITFGLKLLNFREEIGRQIRRFNLALDDIKVGKISGAVGTYQHIDPEVEERVCRNLGLKPAPISNQIVQRDRHAFFLTSLALIGATLEKIATEIRHLQRTEVLEVEEFFAEGQKGSSAMPHKRNPVLSERICGIARLLRGYSVTAQENMILWHERDISHSSNERIILPDACICADFILNETVNILTNLLVYPQNMRRNLECTRGLVFSQEILLALIEKGAAREEAYAVVQRNAMQAWQSAVNFRDLLLKDQDVLKWLTPQEIEQRFNYEKILIRINEIYARINQGNL